MANANNAVINAEAIGRIRHAFLELQESAAAGNTSASHAKDGLEVVDFVRCLLPVAKEELPGMDPAEIVADMVELFERIDLDGSGAVQWSEFTTYCVDVGMAENGASSDVPPLLHKYVERPWPAASEQQGLREPVLLAKFFPRLQQLFVCENGSPLVKVYNHECRLLANINIDLPSELKGTDTHRVRPARVGNRPDVHIQKIRNAHLFGADQLSRMEEELRRRAELKWAKEFVSRPPLDRRALLQRRRAAAIVAQARTRQLGVAMIKRRAQRAINLTERDTSGETKDAAAFGSAIEPRRPSAGKGRGGPVVGSGGPGGDDGLSQRPLLRATTAAERLIHIREGELNQRRRYVLQQLATREALKQQRKRTQEDGLAVMGEADGAAEGKRARPIAFEPGLAGRVRHMGITKPANRKEEVHTVAGYKGDQSMQADRRQLLALEYCRPRPRTDSPAEWRAQTEFDRVHLLAVCSDDLTITLWHTRDFRFHSVIHLLCAHDSATWCDVGNCLFTIESFGTAIYAWDVLSGDKLAVLTGHSETVTSLANLGCINCLASASLDSTIRLWSYGTPRLPAVPRYETRLEGGHLYGIRQLHYMHLSKRLVSVGTDSRELVVWRPTLKGVICKIRSHTNTIIGAIETTIKPHFLITGDVTNHFRIWFIDEARLTAVPVGSFGTNAPRFSLHHMVATPPHNSVVLAGRELHLFDAEPVKDFRGIPTAVCFSEAENMLAVGKGTDVFLYDADTGKLFREHFGVVVDTIVTMEMDNKHRKLVVGDAGGALRVVSLVGGALLKDSEQPHGDDVTGITYLPDRVLVTSSWDREVRVYDDRDAEHLGVLRRIVNAHDADVTCQAVSMELGLVATGARDGTLRLWDIETLKWKGSLVGHREEVNDIEFAGPAVLPVAVATDSGGNIFIWATPPSRMAGRLLFCFQHHGRPGFPAPPSLEPGVVPTLPDFSLETHVVSVTNMEFFCDYQPKRDHVTGQTHEVLVAKLFVSDSQGCIKVYDISDHLSKFDLQPVPDHQQAPNRRGWDPFEHRSWRYWNKEAYEENREAGLPVGLITQRSQVTGKVTSAEPPGTARRGSILGESRAASVLKSVQGPRDKKGNAGKDGEHDPPQSGHQLLKELLERRGGTADGDAQLHTQPPIEDGKPLIVDSAVHAAPQSPGWYFQQQPGRRPRQTRDRVSLQRWVESRTIRLTPVAAWTAHTAAVTCLLHLPANNSLVSCSSDGSVRVWGCRGTPQGVLMANTRSAVEDAQLILAGLGDNPSQRVFNLAKSEVPWTFDSREKERRSSELEAARQLLKVLQPPPPMSKSSVFLRSMRKALLVHRVAEAAGHSSSRGAARPGTAPPGPSASAGSLFRNAVAAMSASRGGSNQGGGGDRGAFAFPLVKQPPRAPPPPPKPLAKASRRASSSMAAALAKVVAAAQAQRADQHDEAASGHPEHDPLARHHGDGGGGPGGSASAGSPADEEAAALAEEDAVRKRTAELRDAAEGLTIANRRLDGVNKLANLFAKLHNADGGDDGGRASMLKAKASAGSPTRPAALAARRLATANPSRPSKPGASASSLPSPAESLASLRNHEEQEATGDYLTHGLLSAAKDRTEWMCRTGEPGGFESRPGTSNTAGGGWQPPSIQTADSGGIPLSSQRTGAQPTSTPTDPFAIGIVGETMRDLRRRAAARSVVESAQNLEFGGASILLGSPAKRKPASRAATPGQRQAPATPLITPAVAGSMASTGGGAAGGSGGVGTGGGIGASLEGDSVLLEARRMVHVGKVLDNLNEATVSRRKVDRALVGLLESRSSVAKHDMSFPSEVREDKVLLTLARIERTEQDIALERAANANFGELQQQQLEVRERGPAGAIAAVRKAAALRPDLGPDDHAAADGRVLRGPLPPEMVGKYDHFQHEARLMDAIVEEADNDSASDAGLSTSRTAAEAVGLVASPEQVLPGVDLRPVRPLPEPIVRSSLLDSRSVMEAVGKVEGILQAERARELAQREQQRAKLNEAKRRAAGRREQEAHRRSLVLAEARERTRQKRPQTAPPRKPQLGRLQSFRHTGATRRGLPMKFGSYTRDQVQSLKQMFTAIDADGSGAIDLEEFMASGIVGGFVTPAMAKTLFRTVDLAGKGEITLPQILPVAFPGLTKSQYKQMLEYLDHMERLKLKARRTMAAAKVGVGVASSMEELGVSQSGGLLPAPVSKATLAGRDGGHFVHSIAARPLPTPTPHVFARSETNTPVTYRQGGASTPRRSATATSQRDTVMASTVAHTVRSLADLGVD